MLNSANPSGEPGEAQAPFGARAVRTGQPPRQGRRLGGGSAKRAAKARGSASKEGEIVRKRVLVCLGSSETVAEIDALLPTIRKMSDVKGVAVRID